MRVLFSSTRGTGHLTPLLPYAKALVARGHEVRVAGPRELAEPLLRVGLDHAPFGHPGDEALRPIWARIRTVPADEQAALFVRFKASRDSIDLLDQRRFALRNRAVEKVQSHRARGIVVFHLKVFRPDDNANADFFADLALQRLFERLALFNLPTRKFPKPCEVDITGTPCDQQLSIPPDDRGNNSYECHPAILTIRFAP